MAEQGLARQMMAQRLMTDLRDDPFSGSRFFNAGSTPDQFVRELPDPVDASLAREGANLADVAYGTAATGTLFAPGAGVADVFGYAPDPFNRGEFLPSFGENISAGNYLDAGLQTLGVAGDVMMAGGAFVPPLVGVGAALKAPRAARVAGQAADAAQVSPNQQMGDALAAAQARYFETGNFEPPTAENPVSVVLPTETEPGIIAFHGSGADFDEFRLEMIGTGEGAQAYGYGLYFTDSEDIAKFYRNSVGGANVLKTAQNIKIEAPSGGTETAANFTGFRNKFAEFYGEDAALFADRYLGQFTIDPDAPQDVLIERAKVLMANVKESDRIPENAEEIVSKITLPERGKIYKVALSPKPDELLDHDAPFSQQSKDVQEKLIKAGYELDPRTSGSGNMIVESIMSNIAKARLAGRDESLKNINARLSELAKEMDRYSSGYRNFNDPRGQVLADEYDALLVERENLPTMTMSEARKLASQELAKAGIPGIKYRAAGSRGAGTSDEAAERNYVIFDDKAVKILEKYGIVGPVLVTGGAVAATQRGGDEEGSIFPDA